MADPHANNTVLLVPFEPYSVDPGVTQDCSLYQSLVAIDKTALSEAQKKSGDCSAFFDGTNRVAVAPARSSLNASTEDFTAECFFFPTNTSGWQALFGFGDSTNGPSLYATQGGSAKPVFYGAGQFAHQNDWIPSQWNHAALVRQSGVLWIYLNGVKSSASHAYAGAMPVDKPVTIGAATKEGDEAFAGFIDLFRYTIGIARYTDDFTPPENFEYTLPAIAAILPSLISGPHIACAYPPVWPVTANILPTIRATVDVLWGGTGRIVGTVKEKSSPANVPVWRRVRLFHERTAALIAETWSDPVTGSYAFNYIKRNEVYFVLAFDHTGDYRGVVADNLTPEAMP